MSGGARRTARETDLAGLAEGAARLAAIIDSSDDAIVSKTLEGVITSWNPGAEQIVGYAAAEAVGQRISMIIPEERHEEEREVLARLVKGERVDARRGADGGRIP